MMNNESPRPGLIPPGRREIMAARAEAADKAVATIPQLLKPLMQGPDEVANKATHDFGLGAMQLLGNIAYAYGSALTENPGGATVGQLAEMFERTKAVAVETISELRNFPDLGAGHPFMVILGWQRAAAEGLIEDSAALSEHLFRIAGDDLSNTHGN